jgi:hypothetical protein
VAGIGQHGSLRVPRVSENYSLIGKGLSLVTGYLVIIASFIRYNFLIHADFHIFIRIVLTVLG